MQRETRGKDDSDRGTTGGQWHPTLKIIVILAAAHAVHAAHPIVTGSPRSPTATCTGCARTACAHTAASRAAAFAAGPVGRSHSWGRRREEWHPESRSAPS